jgi:DedD protein
VQNGEGNSAESSPSTTPSASGEPPAAVETQEEGAAVDGAAPAEQNDAGSEPTTPPRMQPPEPRVVSKPATVAPAVSEARPLGHTEAEPHAKPKPPEGKAMAKPVETKAPLKGSDTKLPPKTAEAKSVEAKTVPKPGDGKAVAKVSEAKSALKSAESKTDEPKSTPAATDARTPSTAPKPPVPVVGGWNVQLGSFASDINAKNLVDKLKAAGYKAYSEPRLEQGVTVFKVRVGPTPGKAEAERIRQRIEGQFDAHGMLVPSH